MGSSGKLTVKLMPWALLTALAVLVGCLVYDSYTIEQQVDPSNQLEVVRYIDQTHRIVSYEGKQYFQSRSYSTWVIGGEYIDNSK